MPDDTLAGALEALDTVIGETSGLPGGDLRALAQDVAGDVAPLARARGIEVAMGIRSRDSLSGRDRHRWRYLLEQATTSVLDELPPGSRLRVELGCVATTSGHRWLQADLAVTDGTHFARPAAGSARDGFRSIVVETALRLLEGALDRTVTEDGRVLRLVAPVER
jgi:hypothetical protein